MVAPPAACSDARPWPRDDQSPGWAGVSPDRCLRGSRPRPGPGDPAARRRSPRTSPDPASGATPGRRSRAPAPRAARRPGSPSPCPSAIDRSTGSSSSTMMGARPRLSSSTSRRRGARQHGTGQRQHLLLAARTATLPCGWRAVRAGGNHSMIWSMGTPPPRAGRPNRRFSATVRSKKRPRSSGTWATPDRARRQTSAVGLRRLDPVDRPSTVRVPSVSGTRPETASRVVDLPAPLDPIRATTSP